MVIKIALTKRMSVATGSTTLGLPLPTKGTILGLRRRSWACRGVWTTAKAGGDHSIYLATTPTSVTRLDIGCGPKVVMSAFTQRKLIRCRVSGAGDGDGCDGHDHA